MTEPDSLDRAEELVTAIRALMQVSAVTDVGPDALADARRLVDKAAAVLGARTREHALRRHLDPEAIARVADGEPWTLFAHNPLGIPLRVRVSGQSATARLHPTPLLEGPPRLLHGGFSAAMLDATLSTLGQAQGLRAVTARLDVHFRAAVPLDRPLLISGRVTAIEGRKVHAEGWIERDGERVVEAEALMIRIEGTPD